MQAAAILEILKQHQRVLVASHVMPDGDAMGSSIAMALVLQALGKECILFNPSGQPEYLSWLALPCPLYTKVADIPWLQHGQGPDLLVSLDCGDAPRLGEEIQALFSSGLPVVVLDHHLANPGFGQHNWIDPTMAATGLMVGLVAEAAHVPLTGLLGQALYVALVSDTGSFAYGNTTAESMHMAARLLEQGLDLASVRAQLDNRWTQQKFQLWGRLMQDVQIFDHGQIAVGSVSDETLNACHAQREDIEGFVEQLRRLHGSRVALLLRQAEKPGSAPTSPKTKISLRSTGADSVRDVAAHFGGGGHANAAAATLNLSLAEALPAVLAVIRQLILH